MIHKSLPGVIAMALLGFDAPLKRSFWRNTPYFGVYGLMPYPGSSFGDLTNLMPPSGSIRLLMEKGGPRLRLFDCDAEAGRLLDGGSEQALELPTLIGLTQHSFEM